MTDTAVMPRSPRTWWTRGIAQYLVAMGADAAADGIFYMALGWVAAHAGSAISAATVMAAGTVPQLILTLLGGVIGDRVGLARVATATLVARMVLVLGFTMLLMRPELISLWALIAISAMAGLTDALHMPAIGGIAGLLASDGEQAGVQGAVSATTRTSAVIATAGGGLLIGWSLPSPGWAMTVLLVLSLLALVSTRRRAGRVLEVSDDSHEDPPAHMLRSGLATVFGSPAIRLILLIFTLANFAATAPVSLGVALRGEEQQWAGASYGVVVAGFAVGSALGALSTARIARRVDSNLRAALLLLVPATVGLALLALADHPALATAACTLTGLALAPAAALLMGEIRERTDPKMMGRVSSVVMLAIFGLIPVGHLVLGAVGEWAGLKAAGLVMASILGLSLVVGAVIASRLPSPAPS